MKVKAWLGTPPGACDICRTPLTTTFTDGRTAGGQWGFMCDRCHGMMGVGHGLGKGQRYTKASTGQWIKTAG